MIPDSIFKSINHHYKDYIFFRNGQEVEKGYKPDFVLNNGDSYVIIESENSSNRKMFIGCMFKAAHFLQNEKKGILVIVMKEMINTKVQSIGSQIQIYYDWIKDKTNLNEIYIIAEDQYFSDNLALQIDSKEFDEKAFKVQ